MGWLGVSLLLSMTFLFRCRDEKARKRHEDALFHTARQFRSLAEAATKNGGLKHMREQRRESK